MSCQAASTKNSSFVRKSVICVGNLISTRSKQCNRIWWCTACSKALKEPAGSVLVFPSLAVKYFLEIVFKINWNDDNMNKQFTSYNPAVAVSIVSRRYKVFWYVLPVINDFIFYIWGYRCISYKRTCAIVFRYLSCCSLWCSSTQSVLSTWNFLTFQVGCHCLLCDVSAAYVGEPSGVVTFIFPCQSLFFLWSCFSTFFSFCPLILLERL
jgi:hypothetical protein